jgi:hypothetical protein
MGFTESLKGKDDIQALDLIISEIAAEVQSLERRRVSEEHRQWNSAQTSSRRVMALAKIADLLLERRKAVFTEGLDLKSPAVKILIEYVLEKVKVTLMSLRLEAELIERFLTELPKNMETWEADVNSRVRRTIFEVGRVNGSAEQS